MVDDFVDGGVDVFWEFFVIEWCRCGVMFFGKGYLEVVDVLGGYVWFDVFGDVFEVLVGEFFSVLYFFDFFCSFDLN